MEPVRSGGPRTGGLCFRVTRSMLFNSLMEMEGSAADIRGTFRLEYEDDYENEFSELSKLIGLMRWLVNYGWL